MIQGSAQAAVVIILKSDEAERLQHSVDHLLQGAENFRHTMHRSSLRLESDLYKIALPQRMG